MLFPDSLCVNFTILGMCIYPSKNVPLIVLSSSVLPQKLYRKKVTSVHYRHKTEDRRKNSENGSGCGGPPF